MGFPLPHSVRETSFTPNPTCGTETRCSSFIPSRTIFSTVANAAVSFCSLYEQNQDNLGSVEYSVDGGVTWLPVVYYLDYVDSGGDIRLNADGTVDAVATFTNANTDTAYWTVNGVQKGGNDGDGIAVPITQALGRFVAPRANDDSVEGKRVEIYRLPAASKKSDVRLRFGQLGTASWYFGLDNLGFYDVPAPIAAPTIKLDRATAASATVSWIGSGTLLRSLQPHRTMDAFVGTKRSADHQYWTNPEVLSHRGSLT